MPGRFRVFLDTSALFAGSWSLAGGARLIMKMGEHGLIQVLISPQVLTEAEIALRRKAPQLLGAFGVLLADSRVEVTPLPSTEAVERSNQLTGYAPDALVLAAAWEITADYFVTLDRVHFLKNTALRGAVPFPVGTPGDFLAWYKENLPPEP